MPMVRMRLETADKLANVRVYRHTVQKCTSVQMDVAWGLVRLVSMKNPTTLKA